MGLHPLDVRPDRGEWFVGRQGNDQIVAVPEIGLAALRLLTAGSTVEEARNTLRVTTGRDLDVGAFVEKLADAGLVASIGDRRIEPTPQTVSLPRLRAGHVRWAMSPILHVLVLAVPVVAVLLVLREPAILPSWDDLLWTEYGTFTLLAQASVSVCLIALHEMTHLVTARAAGVPGRITLGTRLQFLVAQTEVSGIWLKSRRERLTVYLSGIALDAAIWGCCIVARFLGSDVALLPVIAMTLVAALAHQCFVFMRTDLYFVVQDLTGCRNLYADTGRYLRHLAARLRGRRGPNPLRSLRPAERRFLQAYALGTLAGTVICVFIGLRLLTEVTLPLITRSLEQIVRGADPWGRLDAVVTVLVLAGLQGTWVCLWWRRHAGRARRAWHAGRRRFRTD
ncbi:hypothetical protein ACIQPQ_08265 [Streptomyces sp. NPDC091281]|uniref:hypothetical protein n=1 Tax=Streptomyces sp. NPDC091281 TaxID=3365985 RepID=UPI00382C7E95